MGYKTYNYRHYVEYDRSYQWYGFTTSDNNENILRGSYYICHYKLAPAPSLIQKPETTTMVTTTENSDPCYCSNNERIVLANLDDTATFASPRYPSNYCSDHNCRWMIVSDQDHLAIKLEWLVFDVETDMDFVYIYDGEMTDSPKMASCTGSTCADQKSTGNAMQVNFRSDHVTTDLGFKIRVTAVETDECYCSKSASLTFANLHETYTLVSPRYPNSYCTNHDCNWSFTAPDGYGIQVMSNKLDLHNDPPNSLIYIYDGDNALEKQQPIRCGTFTTKFNRYVFCDNFISSTETIHMHFESGSKKSKRLGFNAIITVVENYCETKDLHAVHGSISYSPDLRQDGHAAARTEATLQCFNYSGIITTNSNSKNTHPSKNTQPITEYHQHMMVWCESPKWSGHFKECVPLCDLHREFFVTSGNPDYNAHICTQEQKMAPDRIFSGITVKEFNVADGQYGTETKYSCKNTTWTPNPPLCHYSGILFIGGQDMNMGNLKTMKIFSPVTKTTEYVPLELLEGAEDFISAPLGHLVLLAGGGREGFDDPKSSSQVIDLKEQTVKRGPIMNVGRTKAAAASLAERVFVCGGIISKDLNVTSSCEVFQNNEWQMIESMHTARKSHALIAHGDSIYAIAGYNSDLGAMSSVEKYSLSMETWEFVASSATKRYSLGVALFNDQIIACGGWNEKATFTDICEVYDPHENVWLSFDAKLNPAHAEFSLIVFAQKLYVVGGAEPWVMHTIDSYDANTNQWSQEYDLTTQEDDLWLREYNALAVPAL